MSYKNSSVPENGKKITYANGKKNVPNNPIIPFIEGDGIGPDIWSATQRVLDAAVKKAYRGERKIEWMEIFTGEKSFNKMGIWLPEETLDAIREFKIAIKGPLTTPVGGGMRSLNVALRQKLDLYICLRPVKYYKGTPSPVKEPELVDMVIFRENTEDIYAGIEFMSGTKEQEKLEKFLIEELKVSGIRFPGASLGIKPVSKEGSERLIREAIKYTIENNRSSLTLVHKGNIMKFTEGQFKQWGYDLAKREFGAMELEDGPWCTLTNPSTGKKIVIKDVIADAMLQQIILRPSEYDVIATLNLNGDYISDALAAQVGGIGIAPGANIGEEIAIFEATHGTAPKYAGQDKANPSSVILSGAMMLIHLGWSEASDLIDKSMAKSILNKTVTYDFHRQMEGATLLKCSEYADVLITNM